MATWQATNVNTGAVELPKYNAEGVFEEVSVAALTTAFANGDTMTATVQVTTTNNPNAPVASPPATPGASHLFGSGPLGYWFDDTGYPGLTGQPILYQTVQGYTDAVTLSNITVTD